jgi:hypothetical protein
MVATATERIVHVFLNDVRVQKCVMADTDIGVITRLRTDEQGNGVIAADRESIERITEHGTVRVEFA